MAEQVKAPEKERRDWVIILVILFIGLICVILAGGWAIRFAPTWSLDTDMGSNINPNSDFLTSRPNDFLEPLNPSILTPPAWLNVFLTPGALFETSIPVPTIPITNTPLPTITTPPTITLSPLPTSTNTFIYIPPPSPTSTSKPKPPPPTLTSIPKPTASSSATATSTTLSADLQITKTDNATDYVGGIPVRYIIVASNPLGPSEVIGATVTDTFPTDLTNINWTCVGSGGASCTAAGTGNINDAAVNLPVGSSVTYMVNASVVASPTGPLLTNTATINVPAGYTDPASGNNSAADIPPDQLIVSSSFPYNNIGTTPDSNVTSIPAGTYITLEFSTPLVVGGHPSWDLVYYEYPQASGILMDAVILQIGNGSNWYTILNWGNGNPDTNTNISIPISSNPTGTCAGEPDNCEINATLLYNSTGVAIDLDIPSIPPGTYPYIRIFSPSNPPDTGTDGVDVDAIQVLP